MTDGERGIEDYESGPSEKEPRPKTVSEALLKAHDFLADDSGVESDVAALSAWSR